MRGPVNIKEKLGTEKAVIKAKITTLRQQEQCPARTCILNNETSSYILCDATLLELGVQFVFLPSGSFFVLFLFFFCVV